MLKTAVAIAIASIPAFAAAEKVSIVCQDLRPIQSPQNSKYIFDLTLVQTPQGTSATGTVAQATPLINSPTRYNKTFLFNLAGTKSMGARRAEYSFSPSEFGGWDIHIRFDAGQPSGVLHMASKSEPSRSVQGRCSYEPLG